MFYAKVVSYGLWGNDRDGYEVNNLYNEGTVKINGDHTTLTDKQILKRINGKQGAKQWNGIIPTIKIDLRKITVDSACMGATIEIIERNRKAYKPIGRIELYDSDMNRIY